MVAVDKKVAWDALDVKNSPFQDVRSNDLDNEYNRKSGELLETALIKGAANNLYQAVENIVQAAAGAGNVAVAPFQAVLGDVAMAAKDLWDAGKYAAAKSLISTSLDSEAKKIADPALSAHAKELSENINANLDAIGKEFGGQFLEGVARLALGAAWTTRGAAGALKDAFDFSVQLPAAVVVGGGRAATWVGGKAVSAVGYAVSSVFEKVFGALSRFFGALEKGSDSVQKGSEKLWKATDKLYA